MLHGRNEACIALRPLGLVPCAEISRRGLLQGVALLLVLFFSGCAQEKATALTVQVSAYPGVGTPAILNVEFNHEGDQRLGSVNLQGMPLPTSFVIQADGRQGPATVTVEAIDASGQKIGEGSGTTNLLADEWIELAIQLVPNDFQINTSYQYDQIFSNEPVEQNSSASVGRQIASASNGDFAVVWENQYDALERKDIYCRMFESSGKARNHRANGSTAEFLANGDNADYDMPTIAMQSDGYFLIAWQKETAGNVAAITSRAFTADGAADPNSNGGNESLLSSSNLAAGITPARPMAAALPDKNFVVVWQEREATQCYVKGQLLGPTGTPITSAQGNMPMVIDSFPCTSATRDPAPAVAAGTNGGFMVVWKQDQVIRGTAFGSNANELSQSGIQVNVNQTGQIGDLNVGPFVTGYGVVWSDSVVSGTDTDGSCIQMRRFSLEGDVLEDQEYTVNTTITGNQRYPDLALTGNNRVLVVWATAENLDDPAGGIRGRAYLGNGLPVGSDFPINTTTQGLQTKPTITGHTNTSFMVAFEDSSTTGPDQQGSGIRARPVFPEFEPVDGQIGASCDSAPCGTGYTCLSTGQAGNGNRCILNCPNDQDLCLHGGQCRELSDGGRVCFYY